MTYYLIGSKGRLGQAIFKTFSDDEVVCLDRSVYNDWSYSGATDKILKYFGSVNKTNSTVLVASGLLDANVSNENLISLNYRLPKNIIDGATKLGLRVITFGTVMEGLLTSKNSYVQSKMLLNEYVQSLTAINSHALHIQLHTLYGLGEPSPFMFLGQILSALKNNTAFKMTSGCQLREYHHFLDDAEAIRKIADLQTTGVVNLSHGKPVSLKEIAQQVFSAFGNNHLLKMGALPEPSEENYDKIFLKSDIVSNISFRDSLPAIVNYMKTCYSSKA